MTCEREGVSLGEPISVDSVTPKSGSVDEKKPEATEITPSSVIYHAIFNLKDLRENMLKCFTEGNSQDFIKTALENRASNVETAKEFFNKMKAEGSLVEEGLDNWRWSK